MENQDIERRFKQYLRDQSFQYNSYIFSKDVPASRLTTFSLGGTIKLLFDVNDEKTLIHFLKFSGHEGIKLRFIGNGSNLLISDFGLSDCVVVRYLGKKFKIDQILERSGSKSDKVMDVYVPSHFSLMKLSRESAELAYSGFEFAAGIPASIGGAIRMNAGAHGRSISEQIKSIKVYCPQKGLIEMLPDQLNFAYRNCNLKSNVYILGANLLFSPDDLKSVKDRRSDALQYRKKTQPLHLPSAGSVFRNPTSEISAGFLLEKLLFKGYRIGGCEFSNLHSNWIVKVDSKAKTNDVLELISLAKEKALTKEGICLKEEIVYWG